MLDAPYTTRTAHNLPIFKTKHTFFKNSFFPSAVFEWNKLDPRLRNFEIFLTFKKNIIQLLVVCNCHNRKRIKVITRLCLSESSYPLCNCGHLLNSQPIFFSTVHYSPMKDTLSSPLYIVLIAIC